MPSVAAVLALAPVSVPVQHKIAQYCVTVTHIVALPAPATDRAFALAFAADPVEKNIQLQTKTHSHK